MDMESRVERLERHNRRLTCAVVGLVALLAGTALTRGRSVAQAEPTSPGRITAKEFVLVDDRGQERGAFRVAQKPNGLDILTGAALTLRDASGMQRFAVGCVEGKFGKNSVELELSDNNGKPVVGAIAASAGNGQSDLFVRHATGGCIELAALIDMAMFRVLPTRAEKAPGVQLVAGEGGLRQLRIHNEKLVPEIDVKGGRSSQVVVYQDGKPVAKDP